MNESVAMEAVKGETSKVFSPPRLLAGLLIVLFIAETIIMFTLPLFFPSPVDPVENFTDAVLLVIISAPFLWFLIVRPLRNTVEANATWATALLEHVVDGVVIFDDQGIVKSCNHAAAVMFGYSAREVIGQHLNALFFEAEANYEHVVRLYGKSDAPYENSRISHDEQGLRKEGSSFPMDISVSMVNLAGENTFIGIIRDISDRKQAEEVLRESEKRYHQLFENMLEGYAYCKLIFEENRPQDFIYLNVNTVFEKLTGLKDVVGKKVTEVIPGIRESHPELFETYARVAMTGKPEKFEIYLAPLGAWLSVSVYSTDKDCFVAVFDNINERKQAENVLRESEERFRMLVEHAPDAIYIQTAGRFSYVNQRCLALFGADDEDDLLVFPVMERFHPDFHEIMRERINTLKNECQSVPTMEAQCLRLDGTPVDVEISAVPFDYRGVQGALVFVRDISERKQAEMDLKGMHTQVIQQEKLASIGQLAAGVAHEINNPIGFIGSNLGTLKKYVEMFDQFIATMDDAVQQGCSDAAREEIAASRRRLKIDRISVDIHQLIEENIEGTERIKKIVQDLKTFSHRGGDEMVAANINECLESTINVVWNEIKYVATLKKEFGDIPQFLCNPQQLNQVFLNLLVNASHAIDKQGEITVRTWADEDSIKIAISDTGRGIPLADQNRIFDAFYTTKEVGKGTGLGLSISADIVKKHNGNITVQSEVGKGTTFTVRIPMVDASDTK